MERPQVHRILRIQQIRIGKEQQTDDGQNPFRAFRYKNTFHDTTRLELP